MSMPGRLASGLNGSQALTFAPFFLQQADNLNRRAFAQVIHVGFVGQAECGDLFPLTASR